jgi:hypothetical protein
MQPLADAHLARGRANGFAVERDMALGDQVLQVTARELRRQPTSTLSMRNARAAAHRELRISGSMPPARPARVVAAGCSSACGRAIRIANFPLALAFKPAARHARAIR